MRWSKSKVEKRTPSRNERIQWCQEGRCQAWQLGPPPPQIVHGGWSEWSSGEKQCPITPCHITGSISLKAQLRTCTSPAYACNVLASTLYNSIGLTTGDTTARAQISAAWYAEHRPLSARGCHGRSLAIASVVPYGTIPIDRIGNLAGSAFRVSSVRRSYDG